jgi:hypothetical protein
MMMIGSVGMGTSFLLDSQVLESANHELRLLRNPNFHHHHARAMAVAAARSAGQHTL